jgi:hypothetical protein
MSFVWEIASEGFVVPVETDRIILAASQDRALIGSDL